MTLVVPRLKLINKWRQWWGNPATMARTCRDLGYASAQWNRGNDGGKLIIGSVGGSLFGGFFESLGVTHASDPRAPLRSQLDAALTLRH